MDINRFKQRLLVMERDLAARVDETASTPREAADGPRGDAGDESLDDERTDEQVGDASSEWTRLNEIRAALSRIEAGTFGLCEVDGGPIEEKRLEAIPWTRFCLRHQQGRETPAPPRNTL